jgi:AsmA-like C-terminal region
LRRCCACLCAPCAGARAEISRSFGLSEPRTEPPTRSTTPTEPKKSGRAAQIFRRLIVAAVLLALASVGALFAAIYTADAEFVAGALSTLLGRHVEIGRVGVHLGRRLEVDLERVRVTDPADPAGPPLLEVGRATGVQAWPRLLAGQYLPLDWTLDAPVLRVRSEATSAFDPGALPRLGLRVSDGIVELSTAGGETWSLLGLQLDARRSAFGTRVEGDGSARLTRGDTPVTELALRFSAASDHAELRGTLARLDLAALPKGAITPRGRVAGDFDLRIESNALRGRVDLSAERFVLRVPKLSGPIAPSSARVVADVDWHASQLALELHPLALDDLIATGSMRIGTSPNGRMALDLELAPFEPGRRDRVTPLTFLALRFASWARVKSRIEAGVAEDIHLAIDVPRATAAESLSFDTPIPPNAFVLELRVRDGTYRPRPDMEPLEQMQGELEIRGNVMDIRRVRMTHEGEALPEVNVHLDGMHRLVHLPDAEDHVSGGPGVALAGLAPMSDALRAGVEAGGQPLVLRFEELDLRLPQFMLPVRAASGSLRFPDGGLLADPVAGIVGGAPATFTARWDRAADRVDVDLHYEEGVAPGGPVTGPRWLSGSIASEQLSLPDWPLEDVRAQLTAERAQVTITGLEARLAGGKLEGSGHLDLSRPRRAPFDLDLGVSDFDPRPLCATFALAPASVTGRGYAKAKLSGALRPGGDFATEGALDVHLLMRDGSVDRLPWLVAIARVPSLAGVTGLLGKPLPYRTVDLDVSLAHGKLAFSDGKLLGPELRLLGSGEMDMSKPDKPSDFVVALLFLQTLDRVLEQVPIVRNVVLGDDKNLIAVYLRLQGPRDDLSVTPLPPQTVQSIVGFASNAVVQGVKSLGRLIPLGGTAESATPAPSPEQR